MKKILFLLLFPSLALAQYQGNANQKITLGEQTTADGLVFRGVLNDTALITPLSDTSAYIILDTVNNKFYNYNRATNVWSVAGGGTAVTSITGGTGLTGGTITSTGTLAADTSFLFTQSDTLSLNLTSRLTSKLNIADTTNMLLPYFRDADTTTLNLTSRLASKLNIADTTNMLLPYFRDADTTTLNLTSRFAAKQNNITLTTTGTSGAATLTGATLNIPQYSGGGGITDGDKGDIDVTNSGATWTIDTSAVSLSGNKVTGTLPVANGGTNRTTMPAGYILHGDGTSVDTSSQLFWDRTNRRLLFNTTTTTTGEIIMNASANTNASSFVQIFTDNNVAKGYNGYCGQNGHLLNEAVPGDMIFRSQLGRYLFGTYQSGASDAFTALCIANNRNIGIGTVSPAVQFHTTGGVRFATFAGGGTTTLSVDNNGDLARTSSIELKKDVTPINYGLNEILQINPINFNWIDENKFGNENENGFIAEDVMSVIPNVVAADTHGLFMDYTKLIPILTKAIQEQQVLIKALEQRILNLENK